MKDINKNATTSQSLQQDLDYMINEVRIEYDDKITSLENQVAIYETEISEKADLISSQEKEIKMLNSQLEETFNKYGKMQENTTNVTDEKLKEAQEKI